MSTITMLPDFIGRTRSETAMVSKERSFRRILWKIYLKRFEVAISSTHRQFVSKMYYIHLHERDEYYLSHGKFPEENLNVWNVCVRY